MPMIAIEKNEDWLDAYKRYKKTVWYKRIKIKVWVFGGFLLGIVAAIIWHFLPEITSFFNFSGGLTLG